MFIVFFKTSRRKYEQMEKLEEAATNCRKVIKSFVYNGSTNNGKSFSDRKDLNSNSDICTFVQRFL